jgi:hypothetical protein
MVMLRRVYFLISAILAAVFGLLMFLVPGFMAGSVGFEATPQLTYYLRAIGCLIIAVAVLNFLVRDEPFSPALAAVLWSNFVTHALSGVVDVIGLSSGIVTFGALAPSIVVHLLVGLGALYFLIQTRD